MIGWAYSPKEMFKFLSRPSIDFCLFTVNLRHKGRWRFRPLASVRRLAERSSFVARHKAFYLTRRQAWYWSLFGGRLLSMRSERHQAWILPSGSVAERDMAATLSFKLTLSTRFYVARYCWLNGWNSVEYKKWKQFWWIIVSNMYYILQPRQPALSTAHWNCNSILHTEVYT